MSHSKIDNEAEFAAEADAAIEAGVRDRPAILSREQPLPSAREFVQKQFTRDGARTLHRHQEVYFSWNGTHFPELDDATLRAQIWDFLDKAEVRATDGLRGFNPKRSDVSEIGDALAAVTNVPKTVSAPAWLDDAEHPPAHEIIACRNGLLHLPTRTLHPHTPAFFAHDALPYAFDPDAPRPAKWHKFLNDLWAADPESIYFLQEMFGLLLTADTSFQKIFLLLGPPRSGKGTIARVLRGLLGHENVAGPTMNSLTTNFGLGPLIGKRVAIISDARLSAKTDQSTIIERLLSISGEDSLTIDRKYRDAWTGTLPTRLVVLTNELPRFFDFSGALAGRFHILPFRESFVGREDRGLTGKLLTELPGILNWSIEGLQRLQERGCFVPPASADPMVQQLADLLKPIGPFLREHCDVGPHFEVRKADLFSAWQRYCGETGRVASTQAAFGRDLYSALPKLDEKYSGPRNHQERHYVGIRLKPAGATAEKRPVDLQSLFS